MKLRWSAFGIAVLVILAVASPAFSCSIFRSAQGIQIPVEMIGQSELIIRVKAVDYKSAPQGTTWTTGVPDSKVRFAVEEVVKGAYKEKEIVLAGYLSDRDDWNDRPSPYEFVRPGGRAGSCFANTYRTGGQFLLVLKRNTATTASPFNSDTEYTVNWYPLGPVNEQLTSETDPWLLWVRQQVAKQPAR